jgi:hypothetical protein
VKHPTERDRFVPRLAPAAMATAQDLKTDAACTDLRALDAADRATVELDPASRRCSRRAARALRSGTLSCLY